MGKRKSGTLHSAGFDHANSAPPSGFCERGPDPGSSKGYDRYAYVNNNPINFNDPSGHGPCDGIYRSDACDVEEMKNKSFVDAMVYPTRGGTVTTPFGFPNTVQGWQDYAGTEHQMIDYYNKFGAHAGVDISDAQGLDIYSVYAGLVVYATPDKDNGGNKIVIMHKNKNAYYYSFYMHLAIIDVQVNQLVSAGEVIGTMGNSGAVSIHLHFEVRTEEGVGPQPANGLFNVPWINNIGGQGAQTNCIHAG